MWLWTVRTPHKKPRATMELRVAIEPMCRTSPKRRSYGERMPSLLKPIQILMKDCRTDPNMLKLSDLEALIKDLL